VVDDLLPDTTQLLVLCSLESIDTICTRQLAPINTFTSLAQLWRFEIISLCPRPIRFLTSSGETYWAAFASTTSGLWGTSDNTRRGPKQESIDIFVEASKKYKCETLNVNAVGLSGRTALHAQLIMAFGDPMWLLKQGADASIMMPISVYPPFKRFAKKPDLSDAGVGILPFLYSIVCGFQDDISQTLWDATPNYRDSPITPLVAAVLNAKPAAIPFALRDSPLERFYTLTSESGFVSSNAIFEAVRIGNGRVMELLLANITDEQLAAISDEIDTFFSTGERGTTMLHQLMQADKHTVDVATPAAPGSDVRAKAPAVFGTAVVSRLVKHVKNLWVEDAEGRYPLDVWLSTSHPSYLPEFAVAPEMFWRLRRESKTGPHSPISHILSVRRAGLDTFIKALIEDAQTRENGISALLEEIILDSDPFVIRYIVSGCHGLLLDISSTRSTECAKMCPWKPSDMDAALEKCLNDAPKQKIPEFHYNFNLWIAMGVEATKRPDFAYRVFSKYGSHYDSGEDLKIMLECNVPFTHPDLLECCLKTCNLETCNAIARGGAPLGKVQPCDIPTPKLVYEFAGFASLVNQVLEKGGDLSVKDQDGKTLLEKLQHTWFNPSTCEPRFLMDPVALLKDATHQRLKFLVQLANKGAPWKTSLDLVYFGIIAGGGIGDIRALLSQAGKGLDGTVIWVDLLHARKTEGMSDFALGLICDLLIEFEVVFDSLTKNEAIDINKSRYKIFLKLARATATREWIRKSKLDALMYLALSGLQCAHDWLKTDQPKSLELVTAVSQILAASKDSDSKRLAELPEFLQFLDDLSTISMNRVARAYAATDVALAPKPGDTTASPLWGQLEQQMALKPPAAPDAVSAAPTSPESTSITSGIFQLRVSADEAARTQPAPSFSGFGNGSVSTSSFGSSAPPSPSFAENPFGSPAPSTFAYGAASPSTPAANPFESRTNPETPSPVGSVFGSSSDDSSSPFGENSSSTSSSFSSSGFSPSRSGGKKTPTKWPRKK
jgi:hypothetical protein